MLEQAIRAKPWSRAAWSRQDPSETPVLTISESQTKVFAAAANDLRAFFTTQAVQLWLSNYYGVANTGDTMSGISVVPSEPRITQVCRRNFCNRPWLDELTETRRLTFEVVGQPSEWGLTIFTEPVTAEVTPSEEQLMDSWDRYLAEHWDELVAKCAGEYVAIWNNDVYDHDKDLAALAQRVYAALGYRRIFMPYIGKPRTTAQFLSPV